MKKLLVADSSSLIALAACECIQYLEFIFEVRVPPAVYKELVSNPAKPFVKELQNFLENKVEKRDLSLFVFKGLNLGRGELEAISLYKILGANYLLIDDAKARKFAKMNGVKVVGSLGILLKFKEKRIVEKISPLIDKMKEHRIRFSQSLIESVLKIAGEAED